MLLFVDKTGVVRRIHFISVGTTGEALTKIITNALCKYLRGRCYDGAGNMAGKYEGVAAQIQRKYPKAKYFHCAAHALNLCVVSASNVQAIRNMHGTMQEICLIFNLSPK